MLVTIYVPDNPLDEFNFQAWADSFAERDRIDLTEEEYITAIRNAQGRLAYEYQRRLLFDTPYANMFLAQNKFEMLTANKKCTNRNISWLWSIFYSCWFNGCKAKTEQSLSYCNLNNTKVKLPDGRTVGKRFTFHARSNIVFRKKSG